MTEQSELILGCIVLAFLYGLAIYFLYEIWRDNYKFDVTKITFKPEDKENKT